jgi:hypothetical protein
MECPQQAELRRVFENALLDIDRIIDKQAKALLSTEDATMVEISIAMARRDHAAEALLHHMVQHLCGDGESRLAEAPETHEVAANC